MAFVFLNVAPVLHGETISDDGNVSTIGREVFAVCRDDPFCFDLLCSGGNVEVDQGFGNMEVESSEDWSPGWLYGPRVMPLRGGAVGSGKLKLMSRV